MKTTRLSLIVALAVMITGCATQRLSPEQKQSINTYANSASTLNGLANEEFANIRNYVIALNKMTQSIKPNWPKNGDLAGAADVEDVIARQKAVAALEAYAIALNDLVNDTEDAKLRQSTGKFRSAITDLDVDQKIKDSHLDILEKTVLGIGRFFVEKKKKEAVVAIVAMSRDQVDHLCDLLVRDFHDDGGFASQLIVAGATTQVAADTFLHSDDTDPAGRQIAVEAFDAGGNALKRYEEVHQRIAAAARQMKVANGLLADGLKDRKLKPFKSFTSFRESVEELVEHAEYYTR